MEGWWSPGRPRPTLPQPRSCCPQLTGRVPPGGSCCLSTGGLKSQATLCRGPAPRLAPRGCHCVSLSLSSLVLREQGPVSPDTALCPATSAVPGTNDTPSRHGSSTKMIWGTVTPSRPKRRIKEVQFTVQGPERSSSKPGLWVRPRTPHFQLNRVVLG